MSDSRIEQLKGIFFEEAEEGLETMEQGLLELDDGSKDPELINTIFRAAHSIKGGSGTFGFSELIEFTHSMESLLDAMRSGDKAITTEATSALLESVDHLRALLTDARNNEPIDSESSRPYIDRLNAILGADDESAAGGEAEARDDSARAAGWNIEFKPHPDLMQSGNDPYLIVREIAGLGPAKTTVDVSNVPSWDILDPENLYLGWTIRLEAAAEEAQIHDAFAWVDDQADIRVEPIEAAASAAPEPVQAPKAAPAPSPKQAEAAAPAKAPATPKPRSAKAGSSSIRVSIDKVDALINIVGELVITQSMLGQIEKDFDMSKLDKLRDGLSQLERNTRELQESVMRIRMLPISSVFSRFPRMVRDLSRQLEKKVHLELSGESTELDKTVMEKIGDPLVHLVRNSLDHGLEMPADRLEAGKPETGRIELNAFHQGGNIVIEICDDGRGLPTERIREKAIAKGLLSADDSSSSTEKIHDFIFHPGFSTAKEISDLSGRGVGLDVVRKNIRALGGSVEVQSSPGEGTKFTIRLPLTLAILDGQLINVGEETYIVPLVSIIESLQIDGKQVNAIAGKAEVYRLREQYIPIVRLYDLFGIEGGERKLDGGLLVVVEGDGQHAGLLVDDLQNQQQVVIKSLDTNYRRVDGVSGATILGDGTVALILDIPGLIKFANDRSRRADTPRLPQDKFALN
ncbi:MAG: chemotaxis protein CheA [Deltaproteobacteria bacterium]